MKALTICSLLFLFLALSSPVQGQEKPEWARHLPNLPSRPEHYQGIGIVSGSGDEGADWQKASDGARADIAAQIRVRIISTMTSKVEESSQDGKRSLNEVFQSVTQQIAEGTLEGLQIQRWYDRKNNVYYAYAAMSKRDVESKFNESLHNAVSSASQYYFAGQRAIMSDNPYLALTRYFEALKITVIAESYLNTSIRGDIDSSGSEKPLIPFLQNELCQLVGRIRFVVASGNDQEGEKGRMLLRPFVGRIVYGEASIPMKDALLAAAFVSPAEGKLSPELRSDEHGVFKVEVNEINEGEAVNKVRVSLVLKGLEILTAKMPDAVRCWKNNYVDFAFRLRVRTNVKIAVHILERRLGRINVKSSVQEEIQKKLIGGQYTLIEESRIHSVFPLARLNVAIEAGNFDAVVQALSPLSDVVIVGLADTKERSNPSPGIFFSTGSATIRVIDTRTGRIIASAALDNEKEGGNSYEVAAMKMLQRIGKQLGDEIKANVDKALQ